MTTINSKEDFIQFISYLINDLKSNPADWENKTLPDFLDAIERWTEDMEGYYLNNNLPVPKNVNWSTFADILSAAKIYE